MFVGGFAHKPNVDAVLWFVESIWRKIKNSLPDIKFYIIGSKPPKEIVDLASSDIIVTGFVSDDDLAGIMKSAEFLLFHCDMEPA